MRLKRSHYFLPIFVIPLLFVLQHPRLSGPIHEISLSLLKPVLIAGDAATQFLFDAQDGFSRLWSTFRNQGIYEARIAELEARVLKLSEAEKENERMRKLLDFRNTVPGKNVAARVIGWDPSPWRKTMVIDKGTNQGVKRDMAVIVPEGLVGRVIEAAPSVSRVLLITDPDSRISAITDKSRAQGIVAGDGSPRTMMNYLELDSGVAVDEIVITAGTSGIFPKDIRIGKIVSVTRNSSGLHMDAKIEPFVKFSKLEEVLCIASSREK